MRGASPSPFLLEEAEADIPISVDEKVELGILVSLKRVEVGITISLEKDVSIPTIYNI